jgi:hypothetical protein
MSNFWKDMTGIILNPGKTLGKLMKEKKWIPAFLLLAITSIIFTYVSTPLQIESLSQEQQLSETQITLMQEKVQLVSFLASMGSVFMVFLSICMGAFFIYLFFGIGGSEGFYSNYFSLTVNASILDVLFPNFILTLSLISQIPISKFTNLAILLGYPDSTDLINLALIRIGIFELWYIVAISAGIARFSRLSIKKCLFIGIIYFIFKTAVSVPIQYLFTNIFGQFIR